jgi:hypothetical protein
MRFGRDRFYLSIQFSRVDNNVHTYKPAFIIEGITSTGKETMLHLPIVSGTIKFTELPLRFLSDST